MKTVKYLMTVQNMHRAVMGLSGSDIMVSDIVKTTDFASTDRVVVSFACGHGPKEIDSSFNTMVLKERIEPLAIRRIG